MLDPNMFKEFVLFIVVVSVIAGGIFVGGSIWIISLF